MKQNWTYEEEIDEKTNKFSFKDQKNVFNYEDEPTNKYSTQLQIRNFEPESKEISYLQIQYRKVSERLEWLQRQFETVSYNLENYIRNKNPDSDQEPNPHFIKLMDRINNEGIRVDIVRGLEDLINSIMNKNTEMCINPNISVDMSNPVLQVDGPEIIVQNQNLIIYPNIQIPELNVSPNIQVIQPEINMPQLPITNEFKAEFNPINEFKPEIIINNPEPKVIINTPELRHPQILNEIMINTPEIKNLENILLMLTNKVLKKNLSLEENLINIIIRPVKKYNDLIFYKKLLNPKINFVNVWFFGHSNSFQ